MQNLFSRLLAFGYGMLAYLVFLMCFVYAIGFMGNIGVPKSIDSGADGSFWMALMVNTFLLTVFALQHSVMARQGFKQWWTHIVPQPVERSTYVLFSSLALFFVFWLWQPMGGVIWRVSHPAGQVLLHTVFGLGVVIILVSTFSINHFDLFGVRQAYLYLVGKTYTPLPFATPGPYRYVRHPLYVGWLLFFWATPTMTIAHLVFAVLTTTYILVAIRFEERDLAQFHGQQYEDYRKQTPMLIPRRPKTDETPPSAPPAPFQQAA